ncbi:MAG TPA: tyrosine-type recombinase/integrase, partial [Ktedonobacterales bacterium]
MAEHPMRERVVESVANTGADAVLAAGAAREAARDKDNRNRGEGDDGVAHASADPTDAPRTAGGAALLTLIQSAAGTETVDLAVAAWLHAKEQKSQSVKTRATYSAILSEFRQVLRAEGLDLDAADPRRVRDLLASRPDDHSMARRREHREYQVDSAWVEQLVAEHTAALALAAQAYANRPALTPYGARPVAATTANLRLAALSSFYTYALRHDLLRGSNPISRVERRRVQAYASARPLAYEDLRERLGAIDLHTAAGLRDYALLLLGLHTGRRLSELAGLRREHLVIRPNRVEITWVRCKGGKVMRDELPRKGPQGLAGEALVAWVLRLYGEDGRSDPLLPPPTLALVPAAGSTATADRSSRSGGAGLRGRPIWISLAVRNHTFGRALSLRAIATICEQRLGTSKVHALRHTFARGLEDVGAKVSEIQARLGHEDLGTTGRYLAQLQQGENRHLRQLSALYGLTPQSPEPSAGTNGPAAVDALTANSALASTTSSTADGPDGLARR